MVASCQYIGRIYAHPYASIMNMQAKPLCIISEIKAPPSENLEKEEKEMGIPRIKKGRVSLAMAVVSSLSSKWRFSDGPQPLNFLIRFLKKP